MLEYQNINYSKKVFINLISLTHVDVIPYVSLWNENKMYERKLNSTI